MENLGQRLKIAIEQSKLDKTHVANFMGISEGNLYKLFRKDSFELSYIYKASEVTGKPLSFFIGNDSKIVDSTFNVPLKGDTQTAEFIAELKDRIRSQEDRIRFQEEENRRLSEMNLTLLGKSDDVPQDQHRPLTRPSIGNHTYAGL